MTKIVIASDSFKGTLTSMEVADSVEKGIYAVFPYCDVVKLNVADGGEGTMDAVCSVRSSRKIEVEVSDPLGREITASYAVLDDGTAVVEMAMASGLTLLSPEERNPMLTSTYGTGQMIAHALACGCRRFLIGIGGSATSDAGIGMLSALGYNFLDAGGNLLPCIGASLNDIYSIDDSSVIPSLKDAHFRVACDVDSPLYGPAGTAYVFAPQKGADAHMVESLDAGLEHFASIVGYDPGFHGAGAAGGMGYALKAFLDTEIIRGVDMILDAADFDQVIQDADMVITGEGRYDLQTKSGKTVHGVMARAHRKNIPVMVVAGSADIDDPMIVCAKHSDGQFATSEDISESVAHALRRLWTGICDKNHL